MKYKNTIMYVKNNKKVYFTLRSSTQRTINFLHDELHLFAPTPPDFHNVAQSISSNISSMLTAPMMGLRNSSAMTSELMNLSRKRVLFNSANLGWCSPNVILTCSLRICWVPHWSPWIYFTHLKPGRSGEKSGRRKYFLLYTVDSQSFQTL